MTALWYATVAILVAGYVVLDGADFGAGALHVTVARSDLERRQVLAALGPFWDGNEVWLLAAGGVLFLAFPKVLSAALFGFSAALLLFVSVLALRSVAIALRSRVEGQAGRRFLDVAFASASTLAPLLLGTLLGNVLRGVPLDRAGEFALPWIGSFSPRGELGVLDPYTLLIGLVALVALAHHGALFLVWKTDGRVRRRSARWATRLFPPTVLAWVAATAATTEVAPNVFAGLEAKPLVWLASGLLIVGLVTSFAARRLGRDLVAFLGSAAFLFGTLAAIAASLHPTWLPAAVDPEHSLTSLHATATGSESLRTGLGGWPIALACALLYLAILLRRHRGRARAAGRG